MAELSGKQVVVPFGLIRSSKAVPYYVSDFIFRGMERVAPISRE